MREEICKFMPFWEVVLDKDKEILGKYNQEYFSEQKIGEIIKKMYEQEKRKSSHYPSIFVDTLHYIHMGLDFVCMS